MQGFVRTGNDRRGDAHDKVERARLGGRLFADLVELGNRIEHETAHRVAPVGLADSRACTHRMHVGDRRRTPEHRAHEGDFSGRSAVEAAHAAFPQRTQGARVGIALHRVQRFAGEARHEMCGRADQRRRAQRVHGLVRLQFGHDRIERAKFGRRDLACPGQGGNGFAQQRLCHRSSSATKATAKRRRENE